LYQLGPHLKQGGFFGVPCSLVALERYAKLPITARLVAGDLYYIVHRVSSPRFRAKESTLECLFNLDRKTLRSALAAIERVGLLRLTAGARGELSEFWLCNPITGLLYPEEEGRATPTYNGAPKGKRTRLEAIAKKSQILNQSPTRPTRLEPIQPKTAATASPSGDSLAISEPPQAPVQSEPVCNIHGDAVIHYRADGSPLCGICHPTGNTVPGSDGAIQALASSRPFRPPTAKEIGF
jgi:hypothetical protein